MAKAIGDAHDWDLVRFGGHLAKDSKRDPANNKISLQYYAKYHSDLLLLLKSYYARYHATDKATKEFMKTMKNIATAMYHRGSFARI